jgi:hypothetical protein
MRGFLEQAGTARQSAGNIRWHLADFSAPELSTAVKLAERLEARAAELEYRWLTLPSSPPNAGTTRPWLMYWRRRSRGTQRSE